MNNAVEISNLLKVIFRDLQASSDFKQFLSLPVDTRWYTDSVFFLCAFERVDLVSNPNSESHIAHQRNIPQLPFDF